MQDTDKPAIAPRDVQQYSVGFLKLTPGKVQPLGSGVLVALGKVRGILTAAHVWDEVKRLHTVGLYQMPVRRTEVQNVQEEVANLDALQFGEPPYDESGPDIAFVKLSSSKAADAYARTNHRAGSQHVNEGRTEEIRRLSVMKRTEPRSAFD